MSNLLNDVCRLIWANTYKDETLLAWSEVTTDMPQYRGVRNAAIAAITYVEDRYFPRGAPRLPE